MVSTNNCEIRKISEPRLCGGMLYIGINLFIYFKIFQCSIAKIIFSKSHSLLIFAWLFGYSFPLAPTWTANQE